MELLRICKQIKNIKYKRNLELLYIQNLGLYREADADGSY